jgi:hypothetical protein
VTKVIGDTVLFDTDTWVVLVREPMLRAIGPFKSGKKAKNYATCFGGIALTWHEPHYMCEGCDHLGAVWFNNNWDKPFVIGGPFFDCEDAKAFCAPLFAGVAITLECPDDYWDGGNTPEDMPVNDNTNAEGQREDAA